MHYSYELTVLPTHTVLAPLFFPIKLATGKLRKVEINFDYGCGRAVRCQLWQRAKQILPTNVEGYYAEDGRTISADVYNDVDDSGNLLYLVAWSVSSRYNHTLSIQLEVQGPDEPDINTFIPVLLDTINRLIGLLKAVF